MNETHVSTGGATDPGGPTVGHPLSDGPLPHGKLLDCGISNYREFACSVSTFEWLSTGAMDTIDGVPVHLQVMERCVGGHNVLVKAWPRNAS